MYIRSFFFLKMTANCDFVHYLTNGIQFIDTNNHREFRVRRSHGIYFDDLVAGSCPLSAASRGRLSTNVAPAVVWVSSTEPSCARIYRLTVNKPRPEGPARFLVLKSGSKMRSRNSSGTPG